MMMQSPKILKQMPVVYTIQTGWIKEKNENKVALAVFYWCFTIIVNHLQICTIAE